MQSTIRRTRHVIIPALILAMTFPAPLTYGHGSDALPAGFGPQSLIVRAAGAGSGSSQFVNFETPHVHPIDISPDGLWLAACNTPDGRIEIYSINQSTGRLTQTESVTVGVDPVTVRFRTNDEIWAVNQVSDSISVIDRSLGQVTDTIITYRLADIGSLLSGSPNGDEPADVVFINSGARAVVSCSRTDILQLYNTSTLALLDESLYLDGEDPRAMATDGTNVYVAIFESGNSSTLIGAANPDPMVVGFPPSIAGLNLNNHTDHPYYWNGLTQGGGCCDDTFVVNPPPNDGTLPPYTGFAFGDYVADGRSIPVISAFTDPPFDGFHTPPPVPIIVRKDFTDSDNWKDDVGSIWTRYVTGDRAAESGRVMGWDMLDNDIAGVTESGDSLSENGSFGTSGYVTRQMNIVMAIARNPDNGDIWAVGTDATNEVRFEPNLTGTFTRVMLSITNSSGVAINPGIPMDMNEAHLDTAQSGAGTAYQDGSVSQASRNMSIGDPRGIAFNTTTDVAYISGMGSNNIIAVNSTGSIGERVSPGHTYEVPEGPTGLAHHATLQRLYVLSKFASCITVVNTTTAGSESTVQTIDIFDPTPDPITTGRVHFYGTHENSGLGQLACASCHVDGHMDRLAWDLGNPAALLDGMDMPTAANIKPVRGVGDGLLTGMSGTNDPDRHNTMVIPTVPESGFDDFHPMKGPMTTQTFQDIIGKEPHHWRGDKDGIEQFSGAFDGLQGRDLPMNVSDMIEFKDFVATIFFGPNPFRPLDNTLPGGPDATDTTTNDPLDMTGFFSAPAPLVPKSFSATGTPMETAVPGGGDAWTGYNDYVDGFFDSPFRCVDCHTLPIGAGSTSFMNRFNLPFTQDFLDIPLSTLGNAHQMMVSVDGTGQQNIKVPQLRNQIDKEGFFLDQMGNMSGPPISRAGFGFVHDGVVDGLARFLSEPAFQLNTDQALADMMAFTIAISGADFTQLASLTGAPTSVMPPAAVDQSAHAGMGAQAVRDPLGGADPVADTLIAEADNDRLDLVVETRVNGVKRRYMHFDNNGDTRYQPDNASDGLITQTALLGIVDSGFDLTYTALQEGTGERIAVDRDEDELFDADEEAFNADSANPNDSAFVGPLPGYIVSSNAFNTLTEALAGVTRSPGRSAVIQLRNGSYNEPMTISAPTVLRPIINPVNGTPTGAVIIGAP